MENGKSVNCDLMLRIRFNLAIGRVRQILYFAMLGLLTGCDQSKSADFVLGDVVRATGIVGEMISASGRFASPWDATRTFSRAVSTCGCTSVRLSTLEIEPHTMVDIDFTFDSKGKSAGRHSFEIYLLSDGTTQPTMLPITFEVNLQKSIVFDRAVFDLHSEIGRSSFVARSEVFAEAQVTADQVTVSGLPAECKFTWRSKGVRPGVESQHLHEAVVNWAPPIGEDSVINRDFTLRIASFQGRDRVFGFRVHGAVEPQRLFVQESGFAGMISWKPVTIEFEFIDAAVSDIDDLHIDHPDWLEIQGRVENRRLLLDLWRKSDAEQPPLAGHFHLRINCQLDTREISRTILVLYTIDDSAAIAP